LPDLVGESSSSPHCSIRPEDLVASCEHEIQTLLGLAIHLEQGDDGTDGTDDHSTDSSDRLGGSTVGRGGASSGSAINRKRQSRFRNDTLPVDRPKNKTHAPVWVPEGETALEAGLEVEAAPVALLTTEEAEDRTEEALQVRITMGRSVLERSTPDAVDASPRLTRWKRKRRRTRRQRWHLQQHHQHRKRQPRTTKRRRKRQRPRRRRKLR
jgi:hypothetical protein